jgi:hypothetical protein
VVFIADTATSRMARSANCRAAKKQRVPKSHMSKPSDNQKTGTTLQSKAVEHCNVLAAVFALLDTARPESTCIINTLLTVTDWEFGRRMMEHEQAGQKCVACGEEVAGEFSKDLTQRFGRGFGPAQNAVNVQWGFGLRRAGGKWSGERRVASSGTEPERSAARPPQTEARR